MVRQDQRSEFEAWYRLEHPRIVASLALTSRDRDLALEVAAEAFVRAFERWDRVRTMERRGGWLHRTALNLLKRRLRRRRQEGVLLSSTIVPVGVGPIETDIDLWRAVEALPHRTRTAIALRYVADLREPEIAKAMGVSRGTVATLLSRGRVALGDDLSSTHGLPESADEPEESEYVRN